MSNLFLYTQKSEFKSALTADEIRDKLAFMTLHAGARHEEHHRFRGQIRKEEFILTPIELFRGGFQPEIIGKIADGSEFSIVSIKYRLSNASRTLYIVICVLAVIFNTGLLYLTKEFLDERLHWWHIIPLPLFVYLLTLVLFNDKASEADKTLRISLKA